VKKLGLSIQLKKLENGYTVIYGNEKW